MHDVVLPFERHPLHDQYDIVNKALGIHPRIYAAFSYFYYPRKLDDQS